MSQQAFTDFLARLTADAEMAQAFSTMLGKTEGAAAFEAVAAFAAEKGFIFTAADAEAFYIGRMADEQGELSDEALDDVAGGAGFLQFFDPRNLLSLIKVEARYN